MGLSLIGRERCRALQGLAIASIDQQTSEEALPSCRNLHSALLVLIENCPTAEENGLS